LDDDRLLPLNVQILRQPTKLADDLKSAAFQANCLSSAFIQQL
jgi:hypothetical protein